MRVYDELRAIERSPRYYAHFDYFHYIECSVILHQYGTYIFNEYIIHKYRERKGYVLGLRVYDELRAVEIS